MKRTTALFILLSFASRQLLAWGPQGHAIVAGVAMTKLSSTTKKNIRLLLDNDDLAAISLWADDIRKQRDETFGWHFVDIPKDAASFSQPRDCFRPQDTHANAQNDHHNCVVDRIEIFRQVLADPRASRNDRLEALKFLVHFVGDIHQPLHAVDEARGGNDIKVTVFGSDKCGNYSCNLHGVWDVSLIEHAGYAEGKYIDHLKDVIKKRKLGRRSRGTPEDWANESHDAARQVLGEQSHSIDQSYYLDNIGMVDERLALAGLRLATLLNETLGRIPEKQFKRELEKSP